MPRMTAVPPPGARMETTAKDAAGEAATFASPSNGADCTVRHFLARQREQRLLYAERLRKCREDNAARRSAVIENLNRKHVSLKAELTEMQRLADQRLAQVRQLAAQVSLVKGSRPRPPNVGALEASSGTNQRDAAVEVAGGASEPPSVVSRESSALPMAEAPPLVPDQAHVHVGDATTESTDIQGEGPTTDQESTMDLSVQVRVRRSMRRMKTELPNQMGIWCLDPILKLLERIGIKEYIILSPEAERRAGDGCMGKIVTSNKFERTALVVILVHVVFMGISAEHEARNVGKDKSLEDENWAMANLELVFLGWYVLELALRFSVYRLNFFFNVDWKWNLFDLFCVLPIHLLVQAMMPQDKEGEGGGNFSFARVMRILKMTKMLRVARVMRFFSELRLIMHMIFYSVPVFLWTLVMLLSILYVFGIIFLQGLEGYLSDPSMYSEEYDESLKKLWGSVGTGMISLFMALTGGLDWRDAADPLTAAGEIYYALFLFYIAVLYIAVLNVLIGMFCESAQQVASRDEDTMIQDENSSEEFYRANMMNLYKLLDQDGNGEITYSEFHKEKDNPEVRAIFHNIGLDVSRDAKQLFESLGGADDNKVDIAEFVEGCKEFQGDAKRRQLMTLSKLSRTYMRRSACFMCYVEDTMREIYRAVVRSRDASLPVTSLSERLKRHNVPLPGQQAVQSPVSSPRD